ncbi:MAG: DUF4115 domain-containing protein [Candidatus Promineifilaceae bacterium]
MDELGSILREAREAQGLTLAQAQANTRISTKFLEALERGDYASLPTPVHVRGYLRNYAKFLGLDPQPLLERYEVSKNYQRTPVPTNSGRLASPDNPLAPREDQVFFNPVNVELGQKGRDPESFMRLAIIVALLVLIGLAVNRFFFNNDASDADLSAAVNAILNSQQAEDTPEATLLPNVTPAAASDGAMISTSRNVIELPTPTATIPQLPATMEQINLRLEITERTWLRVTIDGEIVYEGLGRQGQAWEWTAQQQAQLLTGNAIGVFVTINDIQLGKLGGRGQVVDQTWNTTGN